MYKICSVPVLNLSFFSVWPARNRHTITGQLVDSSFVAAHVWSAMTLLGNLPYLLHFLSNKTPQKEMHQTNLSNTPSNKFLSKILSTSSSRSSCILVASQQVFVYIPKSNRISFSNPFRTICLYVATAKPLLLLVEPFSYEKHQAYTIYFHF